MVVDLTSRKSLESVLPSLLQRYKDRCLWLGFDNHGHSSAGTAGLFQDEIGLITGDAPAEELLAAVREALAGVPFNEPLMSSSAASAPSGLAALTAREREVFGLLGRGLWNRPLARQLGISVKTVETHKENLKRKLQLRSTNDLMEAAIRSRQQQTNEKSGSVLIYEPAKSGVK